MQNRIKEKFKKLKVENKKAFIAFITCADPCLEKTFEIAQALEKTGVDILELGVPFSDPLADGPVIQAASQRSLLKGTNLKKIFAFVKKFRKKSSLPLVLMTYYNPVLHYGLRQFSIDCLKNGVDGVIVPDLPIEEAGELKKELKNRYISSVFFISPASDNKRKVKAALASTGFIYYISLTGVTGERKNLSPALIKNLIETKKIVKDKPVCVGFGISNAAQIREIKPYCDGIIVGSAIIKIISENLNNPNLVQKIKDFSKKLAEAVHE